MSSLVLASVNYVGRAGGLPPIIPSALAKQLADKFGYEGHLHKTSVEAIQAKLIEIGCRPFTDKSVRRYKSWMAHRASGLTGVLWSVASILLFAALTGFSFKWGSAILGFPSGIALIIGCIALCGTLNAWSETQASWEVRSIGSFTGVLPDEVAAKMLRIGEAFKDASFSIAELTVRREVRDPFLIAVIGEYRFYVAVWDEPEYVPHLLHSRR